MCASGAADPPRGRRAAQMRPMSEFGKCTVVVGCQWGDEGKGKIVDVLAEGVDIVARYQGGANAGHTVHVGDDEFVAPMRSARCSHRNCRSCWLAPSPHFRRRRC